MCASQHRLRFKLDDILTFFQSLSPIIIAFIRFKTTSGIAIAMMEYVVFYLKNILLLVSYLDSSATLITKLSGFCSGIASLYERCD